MAETVLVNAAAVNAAASSAVVAYPIAVPPEVDFRVQCNVLHSVRFYVANADFATVAAGAIVSAYTETAVPSTAGTGGNVYRVDAGSYDYIACVVTNDGAVPSSVTVAVGYDLVAEAATALFTVAEARARPQLASATDFSDADIIAKELEIRSLFTNACKVDFVPTQHVDEYHDGYGTQSILLDWPRVTAITSASTRIGTTWTALTADEVAALQASVPGEVRWNDGYWQPGIGNVKVTYTAGYPDVPPLVKRAAIEVAVYELPPSNVPWQADGYDSGGTSYSWQKGDGYNGAWSALPNVMLALRLYDHSGIGIG